MFLMRMVNARKLVMENKFGKLYTLSKQKKSEVNGLVTELLVPLGLIVEFSVLS